MYLGDSSFRLFFRSQVFIFETNTKIHQHLHIYVRRSSLSKCVLSPVWKIIYQQHSNRREHSDSQAIQQYTHAQLRAHTYTNMILTHTNQHWNRITCVFWSVCLKSNAKLHTEPRQMQGKCKEQTAHEKDSERYNDYDTVEKRDRFNETNQLANASDLWIYWMKYIYVILKFSIFGFLVFETDIKSADAIVLHCVMFLSRGPIFSVAHNIVVFKFSSLTLIRHEKKFIQFVDCLLRKRKYIGRLNRNI